MRMPVATSRAREEMGECFALGFRFALIGPAGSLAATTTHALLAGKVQRKVRNGVAQIGRRRIISGSAEILAMSAMRLDDRAPAQETRLRSRH
jgi:hypothetical protein